ncbi:MAG TPA: nuclear transport factor 2 family protein [Longimicrobium sp.]|nr:nuclear transport factor 2 family protein [Longimicrobium sp.]
MRRLMEVIAGRAPLEEAARLLAPDVLCHMDRFSTRGTGTWAAWVGFIRSRGVDALEPVVDAVVANPDGTLTARGRFRGLRGGRPVEGGEGAATYRVEGGRIVEIWTGRENYALIFGGRVRHPLRWLLVLAHMSLWSRLPGRPRLPVPPTPERAL